MSKDRCPEHAPETDETARARAYLIETATPGYTMTQQGPNTRSDGCIQVVRRLVAVIAERAGLPFRRNYLALSAASVRHYKSSRR